MARFGTPDYGSRIYMHRDWRGWPMRSGVYGFMQELEARDAHLGGCLRTRRSALAAAEMRVVDTDDSLLSRTIGQFVRDALSSSTGLRGSINQMLDAFGKGWSLAEVQWQIDPTTGQTTIASLQARRQERFALDTQNRLWLIDEATNSQNSPRTLAPDLCPHPCNAAVFAPNPQLMPDRKFVRFINEPTPATPYGTPLTARAGWLSWYKLHNLESWNEHNTRFGNPMTVVRPAPGSSDNDIARIKQAMADAAGDSSTIMIDAQHDLELVNPGSATSAGSSYRELADWCNDEISKIILGQTLTSGEGRRTGSRALGSVHERVLNSYHAADALSFGEQLTAQIARWLTDFNFGTNVPAPRIVFETRDPEHDIAELELDEKLMRIGVPISTAWFYRRYRRPVPAGAETPLRYDEQNMFQYHLHYGVLTINEAREKMGMPPVPWGNVRAGDATGESPQTGTRIRPGTAEEEKRISQEAK